MIHTILTILTISSSAFGVLNYIIWVYDKNDAVYKQAIWYMLLAILTMVAQRGT